MIIELNKHISGYSILDAIKTTVDELKWKVDEVTEIGYFPEPMELPDTSRRISFSTPYISSSLLMRKRIIFNNWPLNPNKYFDRIDLGISIKREAGKITRILIGIWTLLMFCLLTNWLIHLPKNLTFSNFLLILGQYVLAFVVFMIGPLAYLSMYHTRPILGKEDQEFAQIEPYFDKLAKAIQRKIKS